jgi:hypothetical protein
VPSKTLWGRQMVDSVGYTPNPDNTNWQQKGSWKSPKRTEHAEIQGWREISFRTTPRVVLFLQDGAPCENCSPYFRELSRNRTTSFIFVVTRPGYSFYVNPSQGDQVSGMHLPMGGRAEKNYLDQVVKQGYVTLLATSLPAALYFHGGCVFLDARPHDLVCPPLTQFKV